MEDRRDLCKIVHVVSAKSIGLVMNMQPDTRSTDLLQAFNLHWSVMPDFIWLAHMVTGGLGLQTMKERRTFQCIHPTWMQRLDQEQVATRRLRELSD